MVWVNSHNGRQHIFNARALKRDHISECCFSSSSFSFSHSFLFFFGAARLWFSGLLLHRKIEHALHLLKVIHAQFIADGYRDGCMFTFVVFAFLCQPFEMQRNQIRKTTWKFFFPMSLKGTNLLKTSFVQQVNYNKKQQQKPRNQEFCFEMPRFNLNLQTDFCVVSNDSWNSGCHETTSSVLARPLLMSGTWGQCSLRPMKKIKEVTGIR